MSNRALALLWLAAATWTGWWLMGNPLPDGYQNEYLHVGNAFDLWGAFLHGDSWHIRWYLFSNYWPEGMALFSFPFLWVEGFLFGTQSHEALVAGNLVHLGVMLWAVRSLGGPFRGALLAPVLLLLCPGVFGSLVRFEPNLADIAWTAAGLAFLLRRGGLRRRWDVIGFGAAVGIGLMLDRLTVAIFLIPALIPYLRGADRAAWRNLGLAAGTVLLFSGWYYWEFFHRHTEELLSQAPVGEIDSAGQVTAPRGLWSWVYYPLALLDSQAGPVVGALMLLGLASPRSRERDTLLWSVGGATALFTLIAKKQVF